MAFERVNPDTLHATAGYHHVTITPAGRTAHLAGQCPVGLDGAVVAGGLDAQVDQVVANAVLAQQGDRCLDFIRKRGGCVDRDAQHRLQRGLGQFMLDAQIAAGFSECAVPLLVRDEALFGTGQLPKFAEDNFRTTDGRWLIPTAEVSLTNSVRERILDAAGRLLVRADGAALPLSVTAAAAVSAPGEADLPVTRITCGFEGEADLASVGELELEDTSAPGTVGWREVVAVGDEMTLATTDVPSTSISDRLTSGWWVMVTRGASLVVAVRSAPWTRVFA